MGYRTASGDIVPWTSQDRLEVKQAFATLMRMLGWNVPRDFFADNFEDEMHAFFEFLSEDACDDCRWSACSRSCAGAACDCQFGDSLRSYSRAYAAVSELPTAMLADGDVAHIAKIFAYGMWTTPSVVSDDPGHTTGEYQAARQMLTEWLGAWLECQPEPQTVVWVDDYADVDEALREHFARLNPRPRIRLPQVGRGTLRRENGDEGVPMHATQRSEKKRRKYAVSEDR